MFSLRLKHTSGPNQISRAITARRERGEPLLDLTLSNPTDAGLEYDEARIAAALGDARALRYEPSAWGLMTAREAVSLYYRGRGYDVPPERIMLTASTSEAYSYLFKLLCNAGEQVLVPRPSYPLFEYLADVESVQVDQYPLFYDDGWHIDLARLDENITPATRAIVCVSPNNPTGSYLKRAEHEALQDLCRRHDLALIVDEVFIDYELEESEEYVRLAADESEVLTFSLSGLSKVAGLPQLKLGWIVMNGPAQVLAEAQERLELIADTFLSVGTPVQTAASTLLAEGRNIQEQIRTGTRANLDWLRRSMGGTSLNLLRVEGGWYAVVQVPRTRTEEEWILALLARGVLVQPGFFYDFEREAFLVISLLTRPADFKPGFSELIALTSE